METRRRVSFPSSLLISFSFYRRGGGQSSGSAGVQATLQVGRGIGMTLTVASVMMMSPELEEGGGVNGAVAVENRLIVSV